MANAHPPPKVPKRLLVLFFGGFITVGAAVLAIGTWQAWQGYAAKSWPVTQGVVTQSETVRHSGGSDHSDHSDTLGAEIRYRYTWEGKTYQGDKVQVGDTLSTGDGDYARDQVAKYPVGAAVRVSVDPKHPQTAMLEPGIGWPALFLPGFGLAFIVIPSFMAWAVTRALRKATAQTQPPPPPIAEPNTGNIPWEPLEGAESASYRSSCLQAGADGSFRVAASHGSRIIASLFGLTGIGVVLGFGIAFIRDCLQPHSAFDWVFTFGKLIPILVGSGFVFLSFLFLRLIKRPFFDFQDRMCRRLPGKKILETHDVAFAAIRGLQLLRHDIPLSGDSGGYTSYQLNLVLKDGTRRNVMGHGDPKSLEADARTLAGALGVPLWVRA